MSVRNVSFRFPYHMLLWEFELRLFHRSILKALCSSNNAFSSCLASWLQKFDIVKADAFSRCFLSLFLTVNRNMLMSCVISCGSCLLMGPGQVSMFYALVHFGCLCRCTVPKRGEVVRSVVSHWSANRCFPG